MNASFVFGRFTQGFFALFEEQVARVVAGELFDLHQEVSEMFFERGQILIEIEKAFDDHSDLRTSEIRKTKINSLYSKWDIKKK